MMKTQDLIATLARDGAGAGAALPPAAARKRLLSAAVIGLAAAAALAALVFGVRADLATALPKAAVLLKFGGSAALALGGLWLTLRVGEPGRPLRAPVAAAPMLLTAALAALLWPETRAADWAPTADRASLQCFVSVALLALAPLGGLIAVLRREAPTERAIAGAAAGLAAGGLGAMGYALHCPIDTPGYVAFWYPAGVAMAAGLGALIGRRALAW